MDEGQLFRPLRDAAAKVREHMTDEELSEHRLFVDRLTYGFSVVDIAGRRVDPASLKATPNAED